MKRKFKYISSIVLVLIIVISNVNCVFAEDKKEKNIINISEYMKNRETIYSNYSSIEYDFFDNIDTKNIILKEKIYNSNKKNAYHDNKDCCFTDMCKTCTNYYNDLYIYNRELPYKYYFAITSTDKKETVDYVELYTEKPLYVKKYMDYMAFYIMPNSSYLSFRKSNIGFSYGINETNEFKVEFFSHFTNLIILFDKSSKVYYNDEIFDENANIDLFKKPYYKLSEWNALMDKKGTEYQKYKPKSRKDIPSAKTILNGLNKGNWSFENQVAWSQKKQIEQLLGLNVKRYTNVYYEVDLNFNMNMRYLISPRLLTYQQLTDKNGPFYLFGPSKSQSEQGYYLLDIKIPNKKIDFIHGNWKNNTIDFYGVSKGRTFIIDDTVEFDGKYDKDGNLIDDTSKKDDGSTVINGNVNDNGVIDNVGNGREPSDNLPQKPGEGAGIIQWINYWGDSFVSFFKNFNLYISKIVSETTGFFNFLNVTFSFFPQEIWVLIMSALSVVIILRIFGR